MLQLSVRSYCLNKYNVLQTLVDLQKSQKKLLDIVMYSSCDAQERTFQYQFDIIVCMGFKSKFCQVVFQLFCLNHVFHVLVN